ncbi:MAG: TatD family hydrolase [Armatimonadetes bacterium]|nr:TatD family hydrolase [Armatimonadota bacterium]
MSLIDTHCHLNLPEMLGDVERHINLAREAALSHLIVIGIDLETSQIAIELSEKWPEIYAVVGIHPQSGARTPDQDLAVIADLARHEKVVAIGEIGLDYYWDTTSPERQREILYPQLQIARDLNLPVVFHCREAYPDLIDILLQENVRQPLLHCFAGTAEDATRLASLDAYYGVDGPITYKKADELRAVVKSLPRDRVLIETDSPYLTPVPFRGKPNTPAYVQYVNAALASLWEIEREEAAAITTANAKAFFRLP